MLLEYKESLQEEEEWIQEMERRLISEVTDSLNTLKACQLAAQALKVPARCRSEREEQRRRSSVEHVLEQRRSSAAEIRAQSVKAEKKVHH